MEPGTLSPGNGAVVPLTREESLQLARIRRRRAFALGVFAALPFTLAAFFLTPWSRETREVLVLAWVAIYSLATMLHVFSRCPRCGHLFHSVFGFHNPYARTCRGCGLPVDAA